MQIILFTLVGIALYLLCDQLLVLMEKLHGEPLPQRNLVFFVLMLALSLSTFSLLRSLLAPAPGEGAQYNHQEQQATEGGRQSPQPH